MIAVTDHSDPGLWSSVSRTAHLESEHRTEAGQCWIQRQASIFSSNLLDVEAQGRGASLRCSLFSRRIESGCFLSLCLLASTESAITEYLITRVILLILNPRYWLQSTIRDYARVRNLFLSV